MHTPHPPGATRAAAGRGRRPSASLLPVGTWPRGRAGVRACGPAGLRACGPASLRACGPASLRAQVLRAQALRAQVLRAVLHACAHTSVRVRAASGGSAKASARGAPLRHQPCMAARNHGGRSRATASARSNSPGSRRSWGRQRARRQQMGKWQTSAPRRPRPRQLTPPPRVQRGGQPLPGHLRRVTEALGSRRCTRAVSRSSTPATVTRRAGWCRWWAWSCHAAWR